MITVNAPAQINITAIQENESYSVSAVAPAVVSVTAALVGHDGKSAYQEWLDAGNTGTEQDFLDSLVGDKGDPGTTTWEGITDKPSTFAPESHSNTAHSTAYLPATHTSDFAHGDIAHTNRTALNGVSGTNTGDQDLSGKVDKVTGKGLSTEDYTTAEQTKLSGIASGAEVNVNADWSASSGDAQILNKPSSFTPSVHASSHSSGGTDAVSHDNLASISQAGTGVTAGHISGNTQSIAGAKTFSSNLFSLAVSEFGANSTDCARFSSSGLLSFRGRARIEIGGNAYAFRYSGVTNTQTKDSYGLAFNASTGQYTWHTAGGAVISSIPVAGGGFLSYTQTSVLGFATGAGGTVTQGTSKATAVSLAKPCGTIVTHDASLAAGTAVSFTFTNSRIVATDVLILNISGGTAGAYTVNVSPAAGSAVITLRNVTAGALAEALTIKFALIKGVTA